MKSQSFIEIPMLAIENFSRLIRIKEKVRMAEMYLSEAFQSLKELNELINTDISSSSFMKFFILNVVCL